MRIWIGSAFAPQGFDQSQARYENPGYSPALSTARFQIANSSFDSLVSPCGLLPCCRPISDECRRACPEQSQQSAKGTPPSQDFDALWIYDIEDIVVYK
jgi:hypothetical protein